MRNNKTLIIIILTAIIFSFGLQKVFAQYYQRSDYSDISVTRKNQMNGYDYYDKSGDLVGRSEKTYSGDYVYYDTSGNKIGTLKKDDKSYTYYNANGIESGKMRKMSTGEYRYKNNLQGGLRSVTPPPGEDVGFYPPSYYQDGYYSPEMQGDINRNSN